MIVCVATINSQFKNVWLFWMIKFRWYTATEVLNYHLISYLLTCIYKWDQISWKQLQVFCKVYLIFFFFVLCSFFF